MAYRKGIMAMSEYTFFDPIAFLEGEERSPTAAKPANVAKAEPEQSAALASLATLAAAPAATETDEPQPDPRCGYCDKAAASDDPLLMTAVDGEIFVAHAACRDREWQTMKTEHEHRLRMLTAA